MRTPTPAWSKWLVIILLILMGTFGLPGLAAGSVNWFVADWVETLYVVLTGLWLSLVFSSRSELKDSGETRYMGPSDLVLIVAFLISIPLAVLDRVRGPSLAGWAGYPALGSSLSLLAATIWILALRAHREAQVETPLVLGGRELITYGIYRMLRHPIYTALLLWGIGLPLTLGSLWAMVISGLLVSVALFQRIRAEEKQLASQYGDLYRHYQQQTWRLIPYLF